MHAAIPRAGRSLLLFRRRVPGPAANYPVSVSGRSVLAMRCESAHDIWLSRVVRGEMRTSMGDAATATVVGAIGDRLARSRCDRGASVPRADSE